MTSEMNVLFVGRDCFPCFPRDDKRGNWIPACSVMTDNPLFIRVLVILEERKINPSGMPLKRTESAFFEASIFEKSAIN